MEQKVNDSFQKSKVKIVVHTEYLSIYGSRLLKWCVCYYNVGETNKAKTGIRGRILRT